MCCNHLVVDQLAIEEEAPYHIVGDPFDELPDSGTDEADSDTEELGNMSYMYVHSIFICFHH